MEKTAMVPFIESDEATVYVTGVGDGPPIEMAREAVAQFADTDKPDVILDHCERWGATRVLVPSGDHQWTAYTIHSVLAGRLEEAF